MNNIDHYHDSSDYGNKDYDSCLALVDVENLVQRAQNR